MTRAVTQSPAVEVAGETRWPMAGAVVAAAVLTVLLPDDVRVAPNWVLPVVEAFLLILLITGDPGEISRRSRFLPQQLNPGIGPPAWSPRFIDYLYLGFTNATAFSPTDAMPLVPWAKIAMAVQSVISLAILGLVIARAVNVFT